MPLVRDGSDGSWCLLPLGWKIPGDSIFAAVPFGMNAQAINAWLYSGGGMALWDELYGKFNLKPLPAGNTGVQMGGWFNREINSIADFKGLKMRILGLVVKFWQKLVGPQSASRVVSSISTLSVTLSMRPSGSAPITITKWASIKLPRIQ